jgi:tRNA nucleotidyltransferase/poly(A) polymerase
MWYKLSQNQNNNINIPIPKELESILNIIKQNGGTGFLVGGIVRDHVYNNIYGTNIPSKDYDVEVYGLNYNKLIEILKQYSQHVDYVGKSFGVIKAQINGDEYDFSLPRTESKSGNKHQDFNINVDENLTPEQGLARRDLTINSMFFDPLNNNLIDPYGGQEDIKNKILRHTSNAFAEDPLRVLRLMSLAARFGFNVAPETAQLAKSIKDQYQFLPKERVEMEFKKLVQKGIEPGKALQILKDTGWDENFPHIHNLKGVPQEPEHHPEGWSLAIVSPDSFRTGMAIAQPINLLNRQFIESSITNSTSGKSSNITANTKFFIKPRDFNSNLFTTTNARIGDFVFSPLIDSPTSVTPSECFVGQIRTSAENTNKIIGIMFKVPVSSVLTIMGSAINDNEIIQGIIQSVAIYVVNMLSGKKLFSQMQLHNISMQKHATFRFSTRDGNFSISSNIIDSKFSIVNDDIIFYFYLRGIGNVDTHNNNISDEGLHILVNIGDVATHTAHVMNAAADIANRQGLNPEEREVLIYAALCHDFAKPATTKTIVKKGVPRITSYGHEEKGGPMARHFLESIGVNKKVIDKVVPLVENHLNHIHFSHSSKPDSFVKQLAERLHPANVQELERLVEADHSGRPPLPKMLPEQQQQLSDRARQNNVYTGKHPDLLKGADVIQYTGGQGGPMIGQILKEHRNKILNHELTNREQALDWLAEKMKKQSSLVGGGDVVALGVKGPQIKEMLDRAWQAQKAGEFKDKAGALQWLQGQV